MGWNNQSKWHYEASRHTIHRNKQVQGNIKKKVVLQPMQKQ